MDKHMILKPRLSEKSYGLSLAGNTYAIEVPGNANKHTVASAVAAQFDVTVTNVNITNIKGKVKRTVRKGGRPVNGQRSDMKKAYVTLKEGDKLPFFEVEEEADKKAEKKTAKKETK
ncbi:MAG TPA: 50S ribosomal protein L23 [Candidatus Saccharimonadales bacterium]|nr:50S ribosomal protein L23 [Candidatus Saccharimonadales bacterium]